jgi:hypothetical protein
VPIPLSNQIDASHAKYTTLYFQIFLLQSSAIRKSHFLSCSPNNNR